MTTLLEAANSAEAAARTAWRDREVADDALRAAIEAVESATLRAANALGNARAKNLAAILARERARLSEREQGEARAEAARLLAASGTEEFKP